MQISAFRRTHNSILLALALTTLSSALFAQEQPVLTLTADQAVGGTLITLADGRKAVQHPKETPTSEKFTWTFPSPLSPGWHQIVVNFAPTSTRPAGNTRQTFFFDSPNRATVNFQSLGGAAYTQQYTFQLYSSGPISTLEVRPNLKLTDPTCAIASIDFFKITAPKSDNTLQLLDLSINADKSITLPPGVGTGNWQVALRPSDSSNITGSLTFHVGSTGLVTAPAGKEQYVFLNNAPDRITLDTPSPLAGAMLISYPAQPVPAQTAKLLPTTDDKQTITQDITLIGTSQNVNISLPIFPNGAKTAVITSWDDGPGEDLRMAELLKKHGFGGTFFVTQKSWTRNNAAQIEKLGFEIASHTLTHPPAWQISPERWRYETTFMRSELESDLGHPVISFAYPYDYRKSYDTAGEYVLRELRTAGYWSARTTRVAAEKITGYAEPLTLTTDGHFKQPLNKMQETWTKATATPGGVFYIWGHAWENRNEHDWQDFDHKLATFANRPDAWYANQGQLFIWKWLTTHTKFTAGDNGKITITRPWLDPWLAAQCPLTIKVPEGTTAIRINNQEIPVQNGYVTLPQ